MDLDQLLAELIKHPIQDVVAKLPRGSGTLFQTVFDQGHGAAHATHTARVTALEQERTALQGKLSEATNKLSELEKGGDKSAPDAAALRTQYEEQIRTLTEQHTAAINALKAERVNERQTAAFTNLRNMLIARGVDADKAAVMAAQEDVRARLRFSEDAATFDVLQKGKDIPLAVTGEQSAADLLVNELVDGLDPKWITTPVVRGSAVQNQSGAAAGGSFLSDYRSRLENERKQDSEARPGNAGAERMGVRF